MRRHSQSWASPCRQDSLERDREIPDPSYCRFRMRPGIRDLQLIRRAERRTVYAARSRPGSSAALVAAIRGQIAALDHAAVRRANHGAARRALVVVTAQIDVAGTGLWHSRALPHGAWDLWSIGLFSGTTEEGDQDSSSIGQHSLRDCNARIAGRTRFGRYRIALRHGCISHCAPLLGTRFVVLLRFIVWF